MPTIISKNLLFSQALEFVLRERDSFPSSSQEALLDEAGMRFNLSPRDVSELRNLLARIAEEKKFLLE